LFLVAGAQGASIVGDWSSADGTTTLCKNDQVFTRGSYQYFDEEGSLNDEGIYMGVGEPVCFYCKHFPPGNTKHFPVTDWKILLWFVVDYWTQILW
jgi:hypothetical protein